MKPAPTPTPETRDFWDAAAERRLVVRWCPHCEVQRSPTTMRCPSCGGHMRWTDVNGEATLESFVIVHRPAAGWEDDAPYVLGLVRVGDGIRLMSTIVDAEPAPTALAVGMQLSLDFEVRGPDDRLVPVFRPAPSIR